MRYPGRQLPRPAPVALAVTALAVTALLGGCTSTVLVDKAPDGDDPACAPALARLPDTVNGMERRAASSAGTAAWGDPPIVLRCGVAPPGPTTDPCIGVDGVDWVVTEWQESGTSRGQRFTAYGRSPGLEVLVPTEQLPGEYLLVDLTGAVSALEQSRRCIGAADVG